MLLYIFQVILFQAIFLAAYRIWLHKETHFNFNRVYLLVTPVLAMLLPFFNVDILVEASAPVTRYIQEIPAVILGGTEAQMQVEQLPAVTIKARQDLFDPALLIPAFYALGVIVSLVLFATKYSSVMRFFRFKRKEDKRIIHIPNSTAAFTFFNTIFMGEKIDALARKQILEHEQVHVNQKHGIDLLFFEILRIVMWFNPMIFLFQKTIAEVHEFIADRKAAKEEKTDYLNQLLNAAFGTKQVSFINTFFNQSLTKKRIIMLQSKSRQASWIKYLLILPLVGVMLFIASCTQDDKVSQNTQNQSLEEQIADLQAAIEAKETLTETETKGLMKLGVDGYTKGNNLKKPWEQTDADIHVVDDEQLKSGKPLREVEVVGYAKGKGTTTADASQDSLEDIPFAVMDKTPVYPGCENLEEDEARKCFKDNITLFVNRNFDTNAVRDYSEMGVNRIYTRFKINHSGDIVDIQVRAKNEKLKKYTAEVLGSLPQVRPGLFKGHKVNTLYSLPIIYEKFD